ncbi:MAG: hypothetical protein O3B41_02720 [Bacteroidetes bacterium]|nr:hypothetical protein [Bacteroidota bacterium]
MKKSSLWICTALVVTLSAANVARAQVTVKLSGAIFSDYAYTFSSPEGAKDGDNGFDFRRVNFTSDFKLSDAFDARIRLEANDDGTISNGKPGTFIKDLYIRWKNAVGEGHNVVFGVSPPPMWLVSEQQWGYRGLEATLMDRAKIATSRDMGLALSGPVTKDGRVKYGLMFANNSGGKAESDKFKRLYGQLEFYPNESLNLTLGGDYYHFDGGSSLAGNVFLGYSFESLKLGVEGFVNPKEIDASSDRDTRLGASLFGRYRVSETQQFIARFDLSGRDNLGAETQNSWLILGYSFMPEKGIEIVPNLLFDKDDFNDDATLTGRVTVIASF